MANPYILKPFIRKWEGGYSNHPLDLGGATKWGITHVTYNSFYKGDVKNLTEEQWDYIFITQYWDKMNATHIKDQNVANIIVDWAWGSGVASTKKRIQRALGLKDDGIFGPKTMAALNDEDGFNTFRRIWNARGTFYNQIVKNNPKQKVFLKGWMNRLNDMKYNIKYADGDVEENN